MRYPKTLALDLEGTLISNAVSCFPRPGLFDFMFFCGETFDRLVIFTSVPETTAKKIMGILAAEGSAPEWFAELEVFVCERHMLKDLERIGPPGDVWLVDDQEAYILPDQKGQWIPVQEFEPPFTQEDEELDRVKAEIVAWIKGATDILADRRRLKLDETQWAAFQQVLDRPIQTKPRLAKLLADPRGGVIACERLRAG